MDRNSQMLIFYEELKIVMTISIISGSGIGSPHEYSLVFKNINFCIIHLLFSAVIHKNYKNDMMK